MTDFPHAKRSDDFDEVETPSGTCLVILLSRGENLRNLRSMLQTLTTGNLDSIETVLQGLSKGEGPIPFVRVQNTLKLPKNCPFLRKKSIVKAFTSRMLKFFAFNNSKHYFIYFNTSLYNIPNIKSSIFFTNSFN